MLSINLSEYELFDYATNRFTSFKPLTIELEHSLVSVYKWEAIWGIPFLHLKELTNEHYMSYIECMVLNPPKDLPYLSGLTAEHMQMIQDYIAHPMTATTTSSYGETKQKHKNEIITAEVIYSQMIANNVPFECQHWHLNQLTTLIKTCNVRNNPGKLSNQEASQRNASINAQRRAKYNSRG